MKKINLRLIFLAIIIFGFLGMAKNSQAATYYVRTDGNNNCNGSTDVAGSVGNCAFRTVQKGIDTATSPGDAVNIRGDHSNEGRVQTVAHGCVSNCDANPTYITIQTTPGAAEYSGIISPGIMLMHDYIAVHGLGIFNSGGLSSFRNPINFGGDWNYPGTTASHCRITGNHIYNPSSPYMTGAVRIGDGSNYNVIEGNLIEGDTNANRAGGHQTGSTGTTLMDNFWTWTTNQWVGRPIMNLTTLTSAGVVVSNDTNSITTSIPITWNAHDCYVIGTSFWIPFAVGGGTHNTISNNVIKTFIASERIFDGLGDYLSISGNEVSDLLDPNENRSDQYDNCQAHTDIFQVVSPQQSNNVTIENNFFHDIQSQTGMMEGSNYSNWIVRNNVFANITHRNAIGGPGFKFYNNTIFNVAQSDQFFPLEGYSIGEEYKNNIIIGGTANPNYGTIGGLMGTWVECAKNVITKTWLANTNISNWIGQSGTQALLTANGAVYVGTGSGTTGSSQPNWSACANVGNTCGDSGITWTNTAWNTTCVVSGTKDVLFGNDYGINRRNEVTNTFTCNPSAVDGGDPRQYDAEGTKICRIKDSSDKPASNNYYGIWNPPAYSARTASAITKYLGDQNFINGGNPKFVAAYTDCVNNACDFSLQADSPLIGAGMTLAGVTADKNGVARPSSPTIGAYEYFSAGDMTSPSAPQGLSVS